MSGRIYGGCELTWRGDELCLGRRVVVDIVPDAVWPGMWRVRSPGGELMVNRTRARDAARSIALTILNAGGHQETGLETSPIEETVREAA
jgi:hypothetical protein